MVTPAKKIPSKPGKATRQLVPPPDDGPVAISTRFPRAMHEDLRRIAFEERVTINSLILEGVQKAIDSRKR